MGQRLRPQEHRLYGGTKGVRAVLRRQRTTGLAEAPGNASLAKALNSTGLAEALDLGGSGLAGALGSTGLTKVLNL